MFDFSGIEVTQNLKSGRTPRFDVNWKREGNFKIGSFAMTALGLTGSKALLTGKNAKAGVALIGVVSESDQRAKYVKRRGDSKKTGSFRAPELAASLAEIAKLKAPYKADGKVHNVALALELLGEHDGVTWYKLTPWAGTSIAGDIDALEDVDDDTQDDDDDDDDIPVPATASTSQANAPAASAPDADFAEVGDVEDDLSDILDDDDL